MVENPILYKKIEPALIACLKTRVDTYDQIQLLFEQLLGVCGDDICGDPLVVFHGGAVKEGYLVEAAFPVAQNVEKGLVRSRTLEAVPALSMLHYGAHKSIRETVLKVCGYMETHAWTMSLFRREIYRVLDPLDPEKNITEVEVILGQPVRIEHVETLLKGNDQCTMTITLPIELKGECSPDQIAA